MDQSGIVTMLAITVLFFLILLILGVRKSYKLKKENDRLNELSTKFEDEENKPYKDFTEGHMYQQKNKE
jgi:preprotein translocase subunit SecG